jgi:hypothetical protein
VAPPACPPTESSDASWVPTITSYDFWQEVIFFRQRSPAWAKVEAEFCAIAQCEMSDIMRLFVARVAPADVRREGLDISAFDPAAVFALWKALVWHKAAIAVGEAPVCAPVVNAALQLFSHSNTDQVAANAHAWCADNNK